MTQVWCLIGGIDGRAHHLAATLIAAGHPVAMPSSDVAPLAPLVGRYWDAVLPIELDEADPRSVESATVAIEENYGTIDVFAVMLESIINAEVAAAARGFSTVRPGVLVLLLIGGLEEDDRARAAERVRSADLERELHTQLPRDRTGIDRRVAVMPFADCIDRVSG